MTTDTLYARLKRKPGYQQDIQRAESVPAWKQAIPDRSRVTAAYAEDDARSQLRGERHQANIELNEKRLASTERLADAKLRLANKELKIAKRQDLIATGLGVANLGIQGMAGVLQIKDADEKAQKMNEMSQKFLDSGDEDNYWISKVLGKL